jgi:hypothetical protein
VQPLPREADVDDESLSDELDADHADGWDREDATEYRGGSHPVLLERFVCVEAATNLSGGGVLFFSSGNRGSRKAQTASVIHQRSRSA